MKSILLFVLAVVTAVFHSVSGPAFCGTFGTQYAQLGDETMDERFYLNVEHPTGCLGTVSSFTYCYYRPSSNVRNNDNYIFNFAVYRETSSDTYEKVSPVFVVSRKGSSLASFECSQYTPSEPVAVETGDVLGACIFNPSGGDNELISIIGHHTSDISMLLRTSDQHNSCDYNSVPTTITRSSLDNSFSRVVHLYANIVPNPQTTATTIATTTATTIATTTAMTTVESVPSTTEAATTDSTTSEQTSPASIPTYTSVSETITSEDTQTSVNTSSQSTDAASESTGPEASLVAPIVVVLLVVAGTAVVSVMIIIFIIRRQRQIKKSYPLAGVEISAVPAVELESNTAYGVSKIEEVFYETIDSVNAMEPTLTKISDGPAVELESNTAYGVSKIEEAVCYETVDSVNAMEPTLTKISDGLAVELESNTACGISRFGEAFYETIDSDNPANPTLTSGVFTNLQSNESYGVSSGVGQSVQVADDYEYWNVTGQDDCQEYNYINQL